MEGKKNYEPNPPVGGVAAIASDKKQRDPFTVFVVALACGISAALSGAKIQGHKDDATEEKKMGGSTATFKSE